MDRRMIAVSLLFLVGCSLITLGAAGALTPPPEDAFAFGATYYNQYGDPIACYLVYTYTSPYAPNTTLYRYVPVNCTGPN